MGKASKRRGRRSRSVDLDFLKNSDVDEMTSSAHEVFFSGLPDSNDRSRKDERKREQLCRQVQRRLAIVMGGEIEDPMLQGLDVEFVTAVAGGSSLLVGLRVLGVAGEDRQVDVHSMLERLNAMKGRLRNEVASAIHRKRTPELLFEILWNGDDEEDEPFWEQW
jgi:ribosome-binding factor A